MKKASGFDQNAILRAFARHLPGSRGFATALKYERMEAVKS
jgi:hypothetical protein